MAKRRKEVATASAVDVVGDGFDGVDEVAEAPAPAPAPVTFEAVQELSIALLDHNSWNVNEMNAAAFDRLVEELSEVGCIDPIQVVPTEGGRYRIIGGSHRTEAAKVLGWSTIPCVVLSNSRWQSEDLQKLVSLRLNALRGKINATKMAALYNEMADKHGEAALQQLFAITDKDAWRSTLSAIGKGLKKALPAMGKDFDEATKDSNHATDLGGILQTLFSKHGDTLNKSYMVFTFGGHEHVYVALEGASKDAMHVLVEAAQSGGVALGELLRDALVSAASKTSGAGAG